MSVETQPQGAEQNEQQQAELEAMGREQLETLAVNPEQAAEKQEKQVHEAREVINRHEDAPKPAEHESAAPKPSFTARLNHAINYADTMRSVQRQLSPVSRRFSQVVHAPVVEKTSEVLENTIMRPSVALGATWTALIVGLIFYLVARHYGYALSGSEMIFALVGGGLLGLGIEKLGQLFKHRS